MHCVMLWKRNKIFIFNKKCEWKCRKRDVFHDFVFKFWSYYYNTRIRKSGMLDDYEKSKQRNCKSWKYDLLMEYL